MSYPHYTTIPRTPRRPRDTRMVPPSTVRVDYDGDELPNQEIKNRKFGIQDVRDHASKLGENLLGHFNSALDTAKGHLSDAKDTAVGYTTPQKPAGYAVPTPGRPAHYGGGQENPSTPPTSPRLLITPSAPVRPRPRPMDRAAIQSAPPRALFPASVSRRLRKDTDYSPAQGGKRYKKHGKKSKKAKKTTKKKRTHKKRKSHHKKTHRKRR
jgi:hypothetical protein